MKIFSRPTNVRHINSKNSSEGLCSTSEAHLESWFCKLLARPQYYTGPVLRLFIRLSKAVNNLALSDIYYEF